MEVGCSRGGTRLVTHDLRTLNSGKHVRDHWAWASLKLLEQLTDAISVSSSESGRNLGAAGEAEQQLKRTQSRSNSRSGRNPIIGERNGRNQGVQAEADTNGEQQLKRMQMGSAS